MSPDLFAITPIQQQWQEDILAELERVIQARRRALGQKTVKGPD
jgi:hypothetical protein